MTQVLRSDAAQSVMLSGWRTRPDGHGIGMLAFTVPRLARDRYVLGLFCERCVRGPKGSLIIDYSLVLSVD